MLLTAYHIVSFSIPPPLTVHDVDMSAAANNAYPMPPPNADLATTWAYLEEGVDHIMTKLQTGVSYSKYMSLYTVSYNYCTSSRMHGNQDVGLQGRCTCLLPPLRHLETRLTRLLFQRVQT